MVIVEMMSLEEEVVTAGEVLSTATEDCRLVRGREGESERGREREREREREGGRERGRVGGREGGGEWKGEWERGK